MSLTPHMPCLLARRMRRPLPPRPPSHPRTRPPTPPPPPQARVRGGAVALADGGSKLAAAAEQVCVGGGRSL